MKKLAIFVVIALVIVLLKLSISTLGYNNDMEIWKHVSEGMLDGFTKGRSIYTYTHFYNHGPIRSYVLYFVAFVLNKLSLHDMFTFHIVIVYFLALADTITSLLLWKIYNWRTGLIFLLNPVSILITGYHSQIEGTVIMVAFISWVLLLKAIELYKSKKPRYKRLFYVSALILGISLGIKHVFFFFPIYLVLLHRRQKLFRFKELLIYIAIVYSVFFGLFAFEIVRDSYQPATVTFNSIKTLVFEYRAGGLYGNSGFAKVIQLFIPPYYLEDAFSFMPFFKDYSLFFVICIIGFGILTINKVKEIKYVFPFYLLALFACSPSLASQYLAVPVLALAVFHENIISFVYFNITAVHLVSGPSANISRLVKAHMNLSIGDIKLPFFPWSLETALIDVYSQTWVLILMTILLLQMYGFQFKNSIKSIIRNYF